VEADHVPEPVPEPQRTAVYRLVEHVAAAAADGASVELHGHDDQLDVTIDAELTDSEPVAAARARVALLEGTLDIEAKPDGRTRLLARLPMRHALHA
jgi:hypothetical protein